MLLQLEDNIDDWNLTMLQEIAEFLDEKLVHLSTYSVSSEHADSSGIFDRIEHFLGFGLIALQTYIVETASFFRKRKHETFALGPVTSAGTSKIQILNAAANYWKHREEWVFEGGSKKREAIDKLFNEVGYTTLLEYPISGVLTELVSPQDISFNNLVSIVIAWRDDLLSQESPFV